MFNLFLAAILTGTAAVSLPPLTAAAPAATPGGVRIVLNAQEFSPGDAVKVQIETDHDGYLVVMRVDADGRVRVLFPIDPGMDAFVRGNRRYELRGRNDNETFQADDFGGAGLIFAALSLDPLRFAGFTAGDHWDYAALRLSDYQDDPEVELQRFVRQMSGNGRYDFDLRSYRVYELTNDWNSSPLVSYIGVRDPYRCLSCAVPLAGSTSVFVGVSFGVDSWARWYDPYWIDSWWYATAYPVPYRAYRVDPFWARDPWWYSAMYPGQYRPYRVTNFPPRQAYNPHAGERARPRTSIAPPVGVVSQAVRDAGRPAQSVGRSSPPPTIPAQTRARSRPGQQGGALPPPVVNSLPRQSADQGSSRATRQNGNPPAAAAGQGRAAPPAQTSTQGTTPPVRARQAPPVRSGSGSGTTTTGGGQANRGGQNVPPPATVTPPPSSQRGGATSSDTRTTTPPSRDRSGGTSSDTRSATPPSRDRNARTANPPVGNRSGDSGRQAIVVIPGGRNQVQGSTTTQANTSPPMASSRPRQAGSSGVDRDQSQARGAPPGGGSVTAPPPGRAAAATRSTPPTRTVTTAPTRSAAPPRTVTTAPTRSAPPAKAPPAQSTPPRATTAPPPRNTAPPPAKTSSTGTSTRARGGG